MAYQSVFETRGVIDQVAEIEGRVLIGTKIKAPFGIVPEVYVLPMESVLSTKVGRPPPWSFSLSLANWWDFRVLVLSPPFLQTLRMTSRLSPIYAKNRRSTVLKDHGAR